jgi:hypothetical protein
MHGTAYAAVLKEKAVSESKGKMSRRTMFAGVGTVGAVAATATLLPHVAQRSETTPEPKQAPAKGGGYQLTDHVKRYYKTTLI